MLEPLERENVHADIEAVLSGSLARLNEEILSLAESGHDLTDCLATLVAGGKRLRAALAYWSYRAHGGPTAGPQREAALGIAAALELFQAHCLFHDDILDNADTRRGHPAAHRVLAARHRDNSWTGDADHFGTSGAILLGDIALTAAYGELARALSLADLTAAHSAAVHAAFDDMAITTFVGQYQDVLASVAPWGQDPVADEAMARSIIRSKAASYSVRHPLVIGALLAGADADTVQTMHDAGMPLGEAFQIRDDMLGAFGHADTLGKPLGGDFREGKRTVLAARTMALSGDDDRQFLVEKLGNPALTDAEITDIQALMTRTGARDQVEELIGELYGEALGIIATASLDEPGAAQILLLAQASVERDA
ncbi:MAG: polyprenyl synthetase family protein [Cellulomonadaceae bacterium]|jgi:geranylgeranyl diphosphate synthase type I|nr:polyprenyl synthetase family protein [Cellulomonadaceae bacterium]